MRRERRELFGYAMKRLKGRLDLCLYPGEACEKSAINAHSIQNRKTLDLLSVNGHVIMPKSKLTATEPPTFIFKSESQNKATTFTGLCADHDTELFKPIDTKHLDINAQEHLFLIAYRSILREAHVTRKSAIDTQLTYKKGVEKGMFPDDIPSAIGMQAVEQFISAYLVDEFKAIFDDAFLKKEFSAIGHKVYELPVKPSIAVSAMFSTDIMEENTDTPAFITLNLIPEATRTIAIFSYSEKRYKAVYQAFSRIFDSTGDYLLYQLSKLILKKCENFVISPSVYESFSSQQKKIISKYFGRNICGHNFEIEDHRLYLFGTIQ